MQLLSRTATTAGRGQETMTGSQTNRQTDKQTDRAWPGYADVWAINACVRKPT